MLLEAIENLANALNEVQNLGNIDLKIKKSELNFYRKYCDRAAELMRDTEETAPFATTAMRKGLPILNRNLKELIEEIQEKARIACKESKGTDAEKIIYQTKKEIQNAINNDSKPYTDILEDILSIVKTKILSMPKNEFIFSKIREADNKKISAEKYNDLPLVISMMPTMKVISEQELNHKYHKLDLIYENAMDIKVELNTIGTKLDCIRYDIFKSKLNSHDVILNLSAMKKELEKLNEIKHLNAFSIEKLNFIQAENLSNLNNDMLERLNEIKNLVDDLPNKNDITGFDDKLNELKQSKSNKLMQNTSAVITLIGFAMQILGSIPKIL